MSLEFNKVAAAVLGTLVFGMGTGLLADAIYSPHLPETPGFEVAVAEDTGGAEAAAESTVEPIAVRLAAASVENGMRVSKACGSCHAFEQGGANKTGPGLYGVVGNKPGTHEGYAYSPAMVEFGNANPEWTFEQLDAFLANPKEHVPGTKMGYAGLKKPQDRADLLAYMNSQDSSPLPLPAPEAAAEAPPAPVEGAAPAPATDATEMPGAVEGPAGAPTPAQ